MRLKEFRRFPGILVSAHKALEMPLELNCTIYILNDKHVHITEPTEKDVD